MLDMKHSRAPDCLMAQTPLSMGNSRKDLKSKKQNKIKIKNKKIKTKQKNKMKIKTKQKNKMKIEPKQKNNQKDYTKTMSISRNCQKGVRLARPTNPVFFGGQSVGVSGGCFFGGCSLSEFLGSVFFWFFSGCFLVLFWFFLIFFLGKKPEKKTEKNQKKTEKKKKKTRDHKKMEKKGHAPDPGAPGRQPPNPPSLCIGKIWCLLKPTLQYTSIRSLLLRLVFSMFFLVFPFVFMFILFFPFVFIFILFFLCVYFHLVFSIFFYFHLVFCFVYFFNLF